LRLPSSAEIVTQVSQRGLSIVREDRVRAHAAIRSLQSVSAITAAGARSCRVADVHTVATASSVGLGTENAYGGRYMIDTTTGARSMSHVRRFDHVGITVADLDVVTAFFVALGLEVEGRAFVEGEFLETVCGIPNSRTEIVMLKSPDDGARLELARFVRPDSVPGSPAAMANELGLRNVSFEVNDLQAAVDWAASEGYGLVGGIGEYEGAWRMAYVRGPEGIIVSLAERIG
jgi:catechol 2,3-dioxygenase-like lactoylglutathione lyase family enzyme